MDLSEHETASQHRYEDLKRHVTESHQHHKEKEMHIPEVNYFAGSGMGGAGAGLGAGLGGGLLGGILGGALLGNRGLIGGGVGGVVEPCVTPMQLQTATGSIIDAQQNTAVLQGIGDIKAAVPLAEAQVQLALSQAQGQISNQIGTQSLAIAQGFGNTSQQISTAQAAVIAVGESVKDAVNITSAATQLAIANSVAQGLQNTNFIVTQVRDDGDKTRALLVAQNENALRDANTALQIRLSETQAEGRARGTEVNVSQVVNQAQAQSQAQAQQQQLIVGFNQLCSHVMGLQNAVATNSNLIIGNTGATTTGAQTANPVNVRA